MAFWDSSAIVPLCISEDRSQAARRLWRSFPDHFVWRETAVEVESVFARLMREGIFDSLKLGKAQNRFAFIEEEWNLIDQTPRSIELARKFPIRYGLKALDCLQLAAALVWCKEFPKDKNFIAADEKLLKAANSLGFITHDLSQGV